MTWNAKVCSGVGVAALLLACGGGGGTTDDVSGDASPDATVLDTGAGCAENDRKECTTGEGYAGVMVCKDGKWSECTPICEDGDKSPCTTVCDSKGEKTCSGGEWGECSPPDEVCNGVDDDCDGLVDEDLGQETCGIGECEHTIDTCSAGAVQHCNPFEGAAAEECDGKDNDCDGQTDEDLLRECNTACGTGIEKCVDGGWQDCTAPQPQDEVCDDVDNDCDGQTDEDLDCSCSMGDEQGCGTAEGECNPGIQECVDGKWGPCGGESFVGPEDEECDGKDNDCDGQTDEGLVRDCQTACGPGKEVCKSGAWVDCTAPVPTDEVCDTLDNDCDGQTDEGLDADELENNDDCSLARPLGDAEENGDPVTVEANLYPQDDSDWYQVKAKEIGDVVPPCDFKYDPCYVFDALLSGIPAGLDYDLFVFAGDCEGAQGSFQGEGQEGVQKVRVAWSGKWLLDDSTDFFVQVKPAGGDYSCLDYTLSFEFWGFCPDPDTGLCPWDEPEG